jgi:hypothetical protein
LRTSNHQTAGTTISPALTADSAASATGLTSSGKHRQPTTEESTTTLI